MKALLDFWTTFYERNSLSAVGLQNENLQVFMLMLQVENLNMF
jgi:hypothetical protein